MCHRINAFLRCFHSMCSTSCTISILPFCDVLLNQVKLACDGDICSCGNDDIDFCCVLVFVELCCGDCDDVCGGVEVERAVVTTLAGSVTASFADGSGSNACFFNPYDVAVDVSGNVFVAEYTNQRIRKLTSGGGTQIGPSFCMLTRFVDSLVGALV